jgi:3-oxoacyl-[acyl-carrier protein] reductase
MIILFTPGNFISTPNIINISSGVSKYTLPNASLHSSPKAALDAFTLALSKELVSKNIRINSILPGATETEGPTSAGVSKDSEYEKMFIAKTPLGRRGQRKI